MSLDPKRIVQAVEEGKISEREADYYLRCMHNITLAQARGGAIPAAAMPQTPAMEPPRQQPTAPPPIIAVAGSSVAQQPAAPAAAAQASVMMPAATPADAITSSPAASPAEQPDRRAAILILTVFCLLGIASVLYFTFSQSAIGYMTLDIGGLGQSNGTNSSFPLPYMVTGVNMSGVLYGEGAASVFLDTPQGSLLVGSVTSDSGAPRTASPSYAQGDPVELEHAPAEATYYLDDGVALTPVALPFPAPSRNQTLLIIANESGNLSTFRVPVLIGDFRRETRFQNVCDQTCSIAPTNGSLRVDLDGEVFLNVTGVQITTDEPNRMPRLAVQVPEQLVNGTTALELGPYFVDPDGDELSFSAGSSDLVNASVNGTTLMMTPLASGNGSLTIYASDLHELVAAQIGITVIAQAPTNNATADATANGTGNLTQDAAGNGTVEQNSTPVATPLDTIPDAPNTSAATAPDAGQAAPAAGALDCSNPDPNARPPGCLDADAAKYFEEDLMLENTDRLRVARITSLGNLILRGRVYQRDTTGIPGPRDFVIGHRDTDFNYNPTVWIDSQTGDLHLRGTLHEENPRLIPPPGSYTIMNRRGVYLLYAERTAGDLYVRGNVIMFREDVDG